MQDLELRPKMSGVRQSPQAARSLVVARQRDLLHLAGRILHEKGFLAVQANTPEPSRHQDRLNPIPKDVAREVLGAEFLQDRPRRVPYITNW